MLLRWSLLVFRRHVAHARETRASAERQAYARQRHYDAARQLATSVGMREARRTAKRFVFHALRQHVRAISIRPSLLTTPCTSLLTTP